MSTKDFQEAKKGLSYSQSLVDKLNMQQMAEQQGQMDTPMEQPMEETPEQEGQDMQDMAELVKEQVDAAIAPYMEEIKNLISKKDGEPKEVEVKIEGEMRPKEDEEDGTD